MNKNRVTISGPRRLRTCSIIEVDGRDIGWCYTRAEANALLTRKGLPPIGFWRWVISQIIDL